MYTHKEGITLRKIERSDLSLLSDLKKESWWGTHNVTLCNSDDQNRWYDSIGSNELVVIGLHEGEPLGVCIYSSIDWIARSLRISGSIFKDSRKPDINKASFVAGLDFAFEMLNMHRVEAEVLETNVMAQMLEIDLLKFRIEGRKVQSVYKCGKYYDSIMLGLLREEWLSHDRVVAYGDTCNKNFSHDKAKNLMSRFSRVADSV